jgi:2-amino-4-hydroxy-6-hydroxymethyldihydropteridine diphosphokinase
MSQCLISFGANIGDARSSVRTAIGLLKDRLAPGDQIEVSRHYQTPPVGGPAGQPPFVNAVAAVRTNLDPWQVWNVIRGIEHQLGRQRIRRWEARRIDIDILLYDDHRIWTGQLKVPHPRMCMRRFILLPALDVAADWRDPVSQWTIGRLAENVAHGKGSLLLVGNPELKPGLALQEVARSALARWIPTGQLDSAVPDDGQRWVGCMETADFWSGWLDGDRTAEPASKLIFFWEPDREAVAWEDQHRELAVRLRLSAEGDSIEDEASSLMGPRYLLATRDRHWACHEMLAALDAMDCPVEAL